MNTPEETLQKRAELCEEDIIQETATIARVELLTMLTETFCYG